MNNCSYRSTAIFMWIVVGSLLSCSVHNDNSKPVTQTSAFPRVIERAKRDKRSFIMHSGLDTYEITSVLVEKRTKQFTVHLDLLDSLHRVNLNNPQSSDKKHIHMYMRDSVSYTLDEPHTIPLSNVARIELVD